ncbi:MbtH family protein [Ruegeria sp. 2205SS24-7]|uniref:MbtH family protein n=1 Tax=Ruegeria discodermiae TaxID=3064389 RepID=UPI002741E3FC|nr:MbtH family protein [Ruegeria sp. 2205SS24-7]MDP5220829.1 MbtH family protein [Ruegeria sp. 2205SS24-7]
MDDNFEFMVLVNHEEQHSLWPTFKDIPPGWRQVGPVGTKQECLDYVEKAWPDITPLSVRMRMHATRNKGASTEN